jgi:hypothetical protein
MASSCRIINSLVYLERFNAVLSLNEVVHILTKMAEVELLSEILACPPIWQLSIT